MKLNPAIYAGLPQEIQEISRKSEIGIKIIIEDVFGIERGQLFIKTRKRVICNARQLYYSIAYHVLKMSDIQLERDPDGQYHHATVIHGRNVTANRLVLERDFREKVLKILYTYKRKSCPGMSDGFIAQQVSIGIERMMRNESHTKAIARARKENRRAA